MLIGLVGKTNSGKSTFFKSCTLANVEISNRPFVTIAPNHGVGYVKIECVDEELGVRCKPKHGFCIGGNRFVPVELMDVAGLVPGASEGKGLGNQFLDDLRQADAFIYIIDASGLTDVEGKPVDADNYDVCKDIEFLEHELNTWYFNILKKVWKTFARKSELQYVEFHEAVAKQFSGLKVNEDDVREVLKKLNFASKNKPSQWDDKQVMEFACALRKKSKPMIIAANKSDLESARENIKKMQKKFPNDLIIPCSADSELALREAAKADLIDYVPGEKDFKINEQAKKKLNEKQKSALDSINNNVLKVYGGVGVQKILNSVVFDLLKHVAVFPVDSANKLTDSKGNVLPDCLLLPGGSTALDFAYALHTDFGKGFIKAIDAKTKLVHGKDYKLKNRDVLEIVVK